jgi:hypothetical protein
MIITSGLVIYKPCPAKAILRVALAGLRSAEGETRGPCVRVLGYCKLKLGIQLESW